MNGLSRCDEYFEDEKLGVEIRENDYGQIVVYDRSSFSDLSYNDVLNKEAIPDFKNNNNLYDKIKFKRGRRRTNRCKNLGE